MRAPDPGFWRGRRVLLTGHTGFKGAWTALALRMLGARVWGYALPPEPGPSAFEILGVDKMLRHRAGDLANTGALADVLGESRPETILHLAAQAIVARGYSDPCGTFATNVAGTLNLLRAAQRAGGHASVLVVTSDKVYRNDGSGRPFCESDPLGGADPYSASKAACEIAVESWAASFPASGALATARAGNVVGGGDFGEGRLLPDLVRAELAGLPLVVRRPRATRPFQHVLDVVAGYLLFAEDLTLSQQDTPRALNFGPSRPETSVADLLDDFAAARGRPVAWVEGEKPVLEEAGRLALDARLARATLGWTPSFDGPGTLARTARWYDTWRSGGDVAALSERDVAECLR